MSRGDKGKSVSGKQVLVALFGVLALVPLVVWVAIRLVERDLGAAPAPLSWAERSAWGSPPITQTTLEREPSPYSANKSRWRDPEFQISEAEEAAVHRCAELARAMEDWADAAEFGGARDAEALDAVGKELKQIATEQPGCFYPPYLLGRWSDLKSDSTAAAAYYEQAFSLAAAIIKQKFVDEQDKPLAAWPVGSMEITCDRVIEGELNQTLKLRFPALVTDEHGWVYLPVYRSAYRATALPQPPGYQVKYGFNGWFKFPGRIGAAPAAVVRRVEASEAVR